MDRMFGYTDSDLEARYKSDLASLSDLPTLFLGEIFHASQTPAFLGRIDEVERRGTNVHFRYENLFDRFSAEEVFSCGYFDFTIRNAGVDERSRTHWAIKKGNLIEGLLKLFSTQPRKDEPRLFNVEQWPLPVLGHVAVMMPFDRAFDQVYEAIRLACASRRLNALRVDEIYGPTRIMDDVFSMIAQSRFVISDLTGRNPNVLYETGLAHALGREVIMVVQNHQDVPFDLNHIRYVQYVPNQQGLEELKQKLEVSIRAV